jgi:hypothetical protein
MQNRIMKAVRTGVDTVFTFYVRDAQGNVLGVYSRTNTTHEIVNLAPTANFLCVGALAYKAFCPAKKTDCVAGVRSVYLPKAKTSSIA